MTANPPPLLPKELEPLRTELAAYYKELPQLLEGQQEGKYVVFKGDEAHGIWDTFHDARQYGYLRFGLDPFLSQKIDRRFLAMLEPLFGSHQETTAAREAPAPPVAEVA